MIAERLRAETRAQHERVEAVVDVMRADLTRERYAWWVARFYGFIEPWEPRVFATLGGVVADLESRRKLPRLARDVEWLMPGAQSGIPRCAASPGVGTLPRALGSLYVMEGATLGGRHIARHVAHVLGLDGDRGCAYFHGYGEETGPMWRRFGEVLASHATPATDDAIVAGAVETFDTLAAWLAADPDPAWPDSRLNPARST